MHEILPQGQSFGIVLEGPRGIGTSQLYYLEFDRFDDDYS
jgi:hypothetical protein